MKSLEIRKMQTVNQHVHFNYVRRSHLGTHSSLGFTTLCGGNNLAFMAEKTISDLSGI